MVGNTGMWTAGQVESSIFELGAGMMIVYSTMTMVLEARWSSGKGEVKMMRMRFSVVRCQSLGAVIVGWWFCRSDP